MKTRVIVLVLALAMLLPATPSHAATKMTWGITQHASATAWRSGCSAMGQVWTKELARSGVTRFRARWELRGPYDPGYLPTYVKTSYVYSAPFPNDGRNFHQYFTLRPGRVNFATDRSFGLWVKIVGERPSFWQRDIVRKGPIGPVACVASAPGGG